MFNSLLVVGNGTRSRIVLTEKGSGAEVDVFPKQFVTIPYAFSPLIIRTMDHGGYEFPGVQQNPSMDTRYFWGKGEVLGVIPPVSHYASVLLNTNLELYMLLRDKKTIYQSVAQPSGFPQKGTPIK